VVGVEEWAELRREHFVGGKSIKELARVTGLSRNTIRRALRSEVPPSYRRAPRLGVLDPFKDEIHRLLGEDPKLPGVRVRELLAPLGCTASKTIVDDYLRELRPLFAPPRRTLQRTVYRPGELCQFDVWQLRPRCRSGTARPGAGSWSLRAWATRAPVPGCGCSRLRPRTCWPGSAAVWGGSARCRRRWSGIARPASTATTAGRRRRLPRSAANCGLGGGSASRPISRDSHGGQARIKAARFPARKTLDEFDFAFQRSIKKTDVLHLGQLDFLAGKENIVLLRPPGTGKTHLSVALGIRACLAGHRVAFRTATEWVALLADAQRHGRLDSELGKLQRVPLLIVDEVGYIPFDPQAANLMFVLVSRRYERAC